ncbi:AraC family transcriptional regulator [Saccharibacillus deserti]|uniref:AraC family transcriptional regulator n=1 Tax=Saccharibacillus deserti TaxID=1634444 RepID=UPI00155557B5|nr:AraC family transcriptional regulator [Saccharibacillus deserti]
MTIFFEYGETAVPAQFHWIGCRRLSDWLAETPEARNLDTNCLFLLGTGSLEWKIEGRSVKQRSGEALAALEGVRIEASGPGAEGWVIAVRLYGLRGEDGAGPELHPRFWELPSGDSFQRSWVPAEVLSELGGELLGGLNGSAGQAIRRQRLLMALIESFYRQEEREGEEGTEAGIRRSMAYIRQHYARNLTRDLLAGIAGLSPWHYSRKFHEYAGQPPLDYLSAYRIYRAQEHLLSSPMRTREVAARVGFEDASYFSRRFKKFAHCSPRDYAATAAARRICVTSARGAEILIDLGVIPHSVSLTPELVPGRQLERFERHGVRMIRSPQHSLHIEAIRESRPELLICGPTDEYALSRLRELAPAVVRISPDLAKTVGHLAALLGREREADRLLRQMDALAARARTALAGVLEPGVSVMVLRVERTGCRYLGAHSSGASRVLYRELGLSIPASLENGQAWFNPIAPERLAEIDPDYLFLENRLTEAGSSDKNMERLLGCSFWPNLTAVRQGRVYEADTRLWAAGLGSTGHAELIGYVVSSLIGRPF